VRRYGRCACLRQRAVEERRQQRRVLRRVELDLRQRALELREPSLGGYVRATEPLSSPFGDRMQRRVLQELRAAPFGPGVRGGAQPTMKFFNQTRLAESRLTDDQHQLPVALPRPLPAPHQRRHFLLATDEGRKL